MWLYLYVILNNEVFSMTYYMVEGESMTSKILIIEDEKTISRFIELELRHEQFEVAVSLMEEMD